MNQGAATQKRTAKFPTYREVVREMGECSKQTIANVFTVFRLHGGDRDRWNAADVASMARALTAIEDDLEPRRGVHIEAEKVVLRALRRKLEGES